MEKGQPQRDCPCAFLNPAKLSYLFIIAGTL
jgi:hypothetical protein